MKGYRDMARPIEGDAPKSHMLNCKLTKSEDDELARIVRESNVSKSKIVRQALKIVFKRAAEARDRVRKQSEKMIKDGKFSFDKIKDVTLKLEEEMKVEINKMAFDELLEERNKTKHNKKKTSTED
jgi:hypothetical protein